MKNHQEKQCFKCGKIKPLGDFYRHSKMSDGHLNKCKLCAKADVRNNRMNKHDYYKEYDRTRAKTEKRVSARKEYRERADKRQLLSKNKAAWNKANQKKRRAIKALCQMRRHCSKISATPPWLNENHILLIKAKYLEAAWMTRRSGVKHHVDHIVPVRGANVCGLHVPWNLRVIPAKQNAKKGNKVIAI